jgi:hypothetical protein
VSLARAGSRWRPCPCCCWCCCRLVRHLLLLRALWSQAPWCAVPTRCVRVCTHVCATTAGAHTAVVELAAPPSTRLAVRVRACPAPLQQRARVQGRPCWCLLSSRHMHTPAACCLERVCAPCAGQDTARDGRGAAGRVRRVRLLVRTSHRRLRRRRRRRLRCCHACRKWNVLFCDRTRCLRTRTRLTPCRCPPRHTCPPPTCTHARPLTGKDADGHKTCATLGAACKSNRDCCHDFLCARDPGGYGRRCE